MVLRAAPGLRRVGSGLEFWSLSVQGMFVDVVPGYVCLGNLHSNRGCKQLPQPKTRKALTYPHDSGSSEG